MSVRASEDLASFIDDWGEPFDMPGGVTLSGVLSRPQTGQLQVRETDPSVVFRKSDVPDVIVQDRTGALIRHVATGQLYRVTSVRALHPLDQIRFTLRPVPASEL